MVKENLNLQSQPKIIGKFTILIVGGSQGARVFDYNLKNIIINISKQLPIKIIHQTKKKYF